MPDPFKWLSASAQRWALLISLLMSAVLLTGMLILDQALISESAPNGIVSFELAGNIARASKIMTDWGSEGKTYAALSLGLDYLFIIVYALFISLSCVRIASHFNFKFPFLASWGLVLAWAQFLAAMLDGIENYGLIQLLFGSLRQAWPLIARWCALVKFGIVGIGLLYILSGTLLIVILKRKIDACNIE